MKDQTLAELIKEVVGESRAKLERERVLGELLAEAMANKSAEVVEFVHKFYQNHQEV